MDWMIDVPNLKIDATCVGENCYHKCEIAGVPLMLTHTEILPYLNEHNIVHQHFSSRPTEAPPRQTFYGADCVATQSAQQATQQVAQEANFWCGYCVGQQHSSENFCCCECGDCDGGDDTI